MALRPNDELDLYPFIKYKEWTFIPFPCFKEDPETQFRRIKEFNSRDSDILLITALKSGTHWAHELVCMLVDHTTEYNSRAASFNINLDFQTDYSQLEAETKQRIIHSHLPFSLLPDKHKEKRAKIVYVNRNPKDRHASQYCFFRQLRGAPVNWSWKEYFDELVLKDTLYGGWFNYTREMTAAANDRSNNIHPIMYEDLVIKPFDSIKRLATFLEVSCDDKFIEEVAEKCKFEKLKDHKLDGSVPLHPERKSTVFRKGVIGDWKNWFTIAQNEQFDALYQSEMKGLNVEFIYDTMK